MIQPTRRHLLHASAAMATTALAGRALAQGSCAVPTRDVQAAISPDAALQRLREGNARFVAGQPIQCDLRAQVRASAGGQAPFA
ncbi:MAG TPA: carbonic anhydrase, partial [Ottowia sp.]|nr:carbonic anhydrase [Ottowia sp.]